MRLIFTLSLNSLIVADAAHKCVIVLLFFFGFNNQGICQLVQFPLHDGWTFRNSEDGITRTASVPGAIHTDLLNHQLIDDPFYRDNARHLGWIDRATWIYEKQLDLPPHWEGTKRIELVFDGLDTYADVYVNDVLMLQADNMFLQWRIPLQLEATLQPVHIRIVFHPTVFRGEEKSRQADWTYPADSDPFPGKPSVFTRKAPYQFGWDFAPSLPGCGIWREVRLEGWSGLRLDHVWLETQTIDDRQALVILRGTVETDDADIVALKWQIGEEKGMGSFYVIPGSSEFFIPITLENPALWWPRGQGAAYRYAVDVQVQGTSGGDRFAFLAGIRTIALDQGVDSLGTAFRFLINGKPLFVQGANWVPADMFPARVDAEKYEYLLGLAADANMNMLRVWGGGIYEHDLFYDLADSLGILVWQDFMFAGTMYPGDESFLTSVQEEAKFQIQRLRRHPSIALWCGNNEIAVAWTNWGWQQTYGYTQRQQDQMTNDYTKLFEKLLPRQVTTYHPGISYLPSSPVINWGVKTDLAHGNNHFWGIWHGEMDLDSLETWVPRFMGEYGMQSLPVWESIQVFSIPEDWSDSSRVMAFHQRSYKGNRLIRKYIEMEGLPDPKDFQEFVKWSHLLQVRAFEKAIPAHRNASPYCMGTLLWQFNEPWPGASWSIIDYYGRKKPAFDVVKKKYLEK